MHKFQIFQGSRRCVDSVIIVISYLCLFFNWLILFARSTFCILPQT